MKANPTQAWAIASGKSIMIWTTAYLRKDAIKTAEDCFKRPWKQLKKEGNHAVKVNITPIG
jgi:hypothetical protein